MDDQIDAVIQQKLGTAIETGFPELTLRAARLPSVPGKAHAIVGMRRAGKTFYLYQCLRERLQAGVAKERLVYFNFEDERLGGMQAGDLGRIIERYYRQFPALRGEQVVTFCFDEIQVVTGWEKFVRRILDEEKVEILISGSSAKMLSREVATSMRGRAMETLITPFSFAEFLLHRHVPGLQGTLLSGRARSQLMGAFEDYLRMGGFAEAIGCGADRDRIRLIQQYVDAVLFRDIVERHAVANVPALRALVRWLLRNPATLLSVSRLYNDFKSMGIAVSKETLLAFLSYLEDSFLVQTLPVYTRSERRKNVNPRKLYLADHSLAIAFSSAVGQDRGHYLENIVACELFRRSLDLAYYKTASGFEVDFIAHSHDGKERLIQVTAELANARGMDRELRALDEAAAERPGAALILLVEETSSQSLRTPGGRVVQVRPIWQWLLDSDGS